MKLCPALAGMALAIQAGSIVAQSTSDVPENAVLVTATRTARTADQTLASVTVITRPDIERSQANDVPELLRGLAGVNMTSTGGYGKGASLFLRGTNPGHVVVLVDGVKVGSATSGAPTWEFLPLAEIERIEIVRGPRSSLYGSEAIGGVVQIFTRRGGGPTRPSAKVTLGSFRTHDVSAGVSGGPGNTWFNVHAGQFATRGVNATLPRSTSFEPDRDGLDNRYGSFRVGHRLPHETEIELHGLQSRGNTEFDSPGFLNETNFRQSSGGVKLQSRVLPVWNLSLQAGESKDNTHNFRADRTVIPSRFNTKRRVQTWQNDLSLGRQQLLTLGLDNQEDLVTSSENLAKTSRDNNAWFTLYQGELGLHSFQASLRRDDNEQFGQHETGSVAYGYALTPQHRVFTSYGTGFRAPNFVDLYWPDPFFSTGNPNLQPEESKSFELGTTGSAGATQWSASLFRTRIENLIVLTGSNFLPTNLNRATINGLELGGATRVDAWQLGANLTLLDPRDDATDKYLQRRSRYVGRLDVDRRVGRAQWGATLLSQGARYDDPANRTRLGGYTLLNLRVEQTLTRDWRLGMRLENATDKEYQTVAGFNSIGRSLFATLFYQPSAN
jgi:vitamin B12 transporter